MAEQEQIRLDLLALLVPLEQVYENSTLGDIPEIQKEIERIADEVIKIIKH